MKKAVFKHVVSFCLIIIGFASQAYAGDSGPFGPKHFDAKNKWTAIVTAYEPEMKEVDKAIANTPDAQITDTLYYRGVRYQIGTYKGEPIVIFASGISVVNAAMTMQMALDYFPIDKVIMMGIAGAVNPDFKPGDIAVPARWYYHDESVYVNPDPEHKGQYILPDYYENYLKQWKAREAKDEHAPKYKNFGFIYPAEVGVIKEGWEKPEKEPYFSADKGLLALAKKAAETTNITMPSGHKIAVHVGGNGVTGSVFLDNAKYRNWLRDVYKADVTEMESAALAQVCFVNNVDWMVIRSVSDLAGGQAGKNVENVFDAIASGTGAKLLMAIMDELTAK